MEYTTINIEEQDYTVTLWLNRPKVHNAINGEMIFELLHFFNEIACNKEIRVVIIRGKGDSFCAGADINWMKEVTQFNFDQNYLESQTLAKCLYAIKSCGKVVISVAHGAVMGGANGLVAASDIVIAANTAFFAFSEVSIGLVPAVISPYVTEKIGYSQARRLMLLAEKFSSVEAERTGLVHYVVEEGGLEYKLEEIINKLLRNSPDAILRTKNLLQQLQETHDQESIIKLTSEVIAKARISEDGQEGMKAFFSKQKPNWVVRR